MWGVKAEFQDIPYREYNFYEGGDPSGFLSVTYVQRGGKTKLKEIRDEDKKIIEFIHVFINEIPACYLKGFKSAILPEIEESARFEREGEDYYLDFKGRWDWYSREVKQLKIQIRLKESSFSIEMPSCCRMIWVKRILEEGGASSNDPYLLFYNDLPLEDAVTAADYGLIDNDVIEASTRSALIDGPSSLQMATGGGYDSIADFESYIAQMQEKINIVCQIRIPRGYGQYEWGTGFLIGHYLIMTNQHVVKRGLGGAKAKFFYHGKSLDEIDIPLDPESVCESESPGNKPPTQDQLDYAILRLDPLSQMSVRQLEVLQGLNTVAEQFFNKALERFENKNTLSRLSLNERRAEQKARLKRANIIQHPLLKDTKSGKSGPQPKQIAFRDNRVYSHDNLMLHYQSETRPGSSGSPVINDSGEWIGVHYSECNVVKQELFSYVIKLCALLNFQHSETESDDRAFCFIKKEKLLYVHCHKEHKGLCTYDAKDAEKFTLRELIMQECDEVKTGKVPLAKFILRFLESESRTLDESHLYCNTAIIVDAIFKDLKENGQKQQKLKEARDLADNEWSIFTALSGEERAAFVNFSKEEKDLFATLPAEERSCYCELKEEDRELFLALSTHERYHCISMPLYDREAFVRMSEKKRKHFINMTKNERRAFVRMHPEERKRFIKMSSEHRAYFIKMDGSRDNSNVFRFLFMSEIERADFIKEQRPFFQRYKWPIIAGAVCVGVFAAAYFWPKKSGPTS